MRSACSKPTPGSSRSLRTSAVLTGTRSAMAVLLHGGPDMAPNPHRWLGPPRQSRRRASTLNLRAPPCPVGISQQALDQLARAVARELRMEGDVARRLVVGQVRAAERADLGDGERRARAELQRGVHALAPLGVGHPEDG